MVNVPRMRSIRQLALEYFNADPQTSVNQHYLRQLIAKNAIPYVRAGRKFLINAQTLEDYLTRGDNH
jgi:excisionase family DNA binding protein